MSYLVLARKWRPQCFEEVIGQSHVTRALQNALSTGKVAHALIFSGPRGVGKTSVARILAKSLNCTNGPTASPCNSCDVCKQITAGNCVDVNEIDGASNRGIDEIRQLREEIRFQPVLCRYRIYIIDEVHMLTNEAFNALLKTLEEPPAHAYFIFATTEPRKIPETIRSRCQHYEFRRLSESVLQQHLEWIVEREGLGLPREAIQLLACQAQGSVRDSLSLLDQITAYGAKNYEEVCQALGVAGLVTVEGLVKALLENDIEKALSVLDRVYDLGADLQRLAQDLLKFLRDLAVIKNVNEKSACSLTQLSAERIRELSQTFSEIPFLTILQAMDMVSESVDEIYRSFTPRTSLEILFMKICSLAQCAKIDEVLEGLEKLVLHGEDGGGNDADFNSDQTSEGPEQNLKNSQISSGQRESGSPQDTKDKASNKERIQADYKSLWPQFVKFVKDKDPGLGAILDSCVEIKPHGKGRLKVLCSKDFKGEMLCSPERVHQINGLAASFFNAPVDIAFEIQDKADHNSSDVSAKKAEFSSRPSQRQELIKNPLVQEAINIFQARISGVTLYTRNNKRQRS